MRPVHWSLLALVTLATVLLSIFGPAHPHPHWWDRIPLFYAAFGFLGCLFLILVSKGLGKAFLQKKESYYEHHR